MFDRTFTTLVTVSLVSVLVLGLATPRPAAAGDLGKILAGAAVGYLVYSALDHGTSGSQVYRNYDPPRQNERSAPRETPRQVYDEGYRDGWRDGENYGYQQGEQEGERRGYNWGWQDGADYGYRQGWGNGYQTGQRDGNDGPRGGRYRPPSGYSPWSY